MRQHQKYCPALIVPSPALVTPLPASKFPNELAPNAPNNILRNLLCFISIVSLATIFQ